MRWRWRRESPTRRQGDERGPTASAPGRGHGEAAEHRGGGSENPAPRSAKQTNARRTPAREYRDPPRRGEKAVNNQAGAVQPAPEDERPAGAVPQAVMRNVTSSAGDTGRA
jgi:hypothetical protein